MGAVVDSLRVDPGVVSAVLEHSYDQGWTDGLPTVPCTAELLELFLEQADRPADEVVLALGHLNRACTVRLAAINAAMAGCRPEYFPVVLAAWDALRAEGFVSAGMWQSTTGIATLLLVNGPVRDRIGLNSRANVFGAGARANATIGRALRLTAINVFGLAPGVLDQSTQGTPAKCTFCIGENEEDSPWGGLAAEHGYAADQSTVTAISMRSVSHIEARHALTAEQLLHDVAGTVARTGGLLQETTTTCLVLSPEHAHLLAGQGFDRPVDPRVSARAFCHPGSRPDPRRQGRGLDPATASAAWRPRRRVGRRAAGRRHVAGARRARGRERSRCRGPQLRDLGGRRRPRRRCARPEHRPHQPLTSDRTIRGDARARPRSDVGRRPRGRANRARQ